jgi:catechol 2,3-dioxygenase-like lactoylglutathione lyase family enzyme
MTDGHVAAPVRDAAARRTTLYVAVTLFHADGEANNYPAAGLFALFFAPDVQAGTARWAARFGAALAAVR